jgi:glucose/arabinose dehydrogenase
MRVMVGRVGLALVTLALAACGIADSASASRDAERLPAAPAGFAVSVLAHVRAPRELAVAPNGDLFVGTLGSEVYVVPDAESAPREPSVFVRVDDAPAAGIALGDGALFVGGQFGIWRIPYQTGDRKASAAPARIAKVRASGGARGHVTTSVAFASGRLYASVGSSCDACDPELDESRATIQQMAGDGSAMHPRAIHIRNAVALAVNGRSGRVWAGDAGQDELEPGHPYEIFDPVTAHAAVADYGWPHCYDDHKAATASRNCAQQTTPRVAFPAYATPIGAAFYTPDAHGRYVFPSSYAGGAFVALHGSWHRPLVPPRVVFVPLKGDEPATGLDWNDPSKQWREFLGGYQDASGHRIGRPTGVAVGTEGSLFVADDGAGVIYRIRPK